MNLNHHYFAYSQRLADPSRRVLVSFSFTISLWGLLT